jgi:geranylgeranyl diphosphate synthase type I
MNTEGCGVPAASRADTINIMSMSRIRKDVDAALQAFVDRQRPALLAISPDLAPVLAALDALLAGGKRLRPAFCYWGWQAAGGQEPRDGIVTAAASLELLQASALVHDDVMDSSDTRRGQPSAHRRFEALAVQEGWRGAAAPFGEGSAILLGDLCLAWSSEMYETSGMDAARVAEGRRVYDLMRTEVMCGQYLDLLEGVRGAGTVDTALRVVEFKAAKYTIERPLHLGHALAAGAPHLAGAYSAYGLPLGEAFQLRDDILGVFGAPEVTGKPAGDDLREGKETYLVLLTRQGAGRAGRQLLESALGNAKLSEDEVAELRRVIADSGALDATEARIGRLLEQAKECMAGAGGIDETAREALLALADHVADRSA